MHNVAHDEEFITTTLAETIKVDEFTANLFNIYRKVLALGFTQVRHLVRHQPRPLALTSTHIHLHPYTPTSMPIVSTPLTQAFIHSALGTRLQYRYFG